MFDVFFLSLALIVMVIAAFIIRAVRLTNASLRSASRHQNLMHAEVARRVIEEMRAKDVRCGRCGGQTFALLETEDRYRCETCSLEFEGPAHIPNVAFEDGLDAPRDPR